MSNLFTKSLQNPTGIVSTIQTAPLAPEHSQTPHHWQGSPHMIDKNQVHSTVGFSGCSPARPLAGYTPLFTTASPSACLWTPAAHQTAAAHWLSAAPACAAADQTLPAHPHPRDCCCCCCCCYPGNCPYLHSRDTAAHSHDCNRANTVSTQCLCGCCCNPCPFCNKILSVIETPPAQISLMHRSASGSG